MTYSGTLAAILAAHQLQRSQSGLSEFATSAVLTRVAQRRAEDMASRNYFSHVSPSGETSAQLLGSLGYQSTAMAENIGRATPIGDEAMSMVMSGWLASPGHRENILRPILTHIGIGYARSGEWSVFVVVFSD